MAGRGAPFTRSRKGNSFALMTKLNLPAKFRRMPELAIVMQKSGESIHMSLGRLLVTLDHFATISKRNRHTIEEINVIAEWYRLDIHYAEILEAAGFGLIEDGFFKVNMPYHWGWDCPQSPGGKARAKNAIRDKNGRYVKRDDPKSISTKDNVIRAGADGQLSASQDYSESSL